MIDFSRITLESLKIDWVELDSKIENTIFTKALKKSVDNVRKNLSEFANIFPAPSGIGGSYKPISSPDWTESFWTGMIWLAYEITKEECFKEIGLLHSKLFRDRFDRNDTLEHHDIGFLYSLSCVAAYKLTEDKCSKETGVLAAKKLSKFYREKAGIIQRGGVMADETHKHTGVCIIDCCMNVPLLYWASTMTGEDKYYNMAYTHITNVVKYLVKDNGSTNQDCKMDIHTGEVIKVWTSQGDGGESACWSRGQAWGIYGLALSYAYTKDYRLLEVAKRLINYFLNRLQSDHCANWDFLYQSDDGQRDTSAVSIAVCGILEVAKQMPITDPLRAQYEAAAKVMTESLINNYMYDKSDHSNALLKSGVYAYNINLGINEPTIWGDYYFMESLVRLTNFYCLYW